jgi:thiamine-monophosphate kinase
MPLSEFDLISKYFSKTRCRTPEITCGIGDDAAVVSVPHDMELVISMDTLVSGIHFPETSYPQDVGYKALAVNLSDMAAMGADPHWISLALTMPENDETWLGKFMEGFDELAQQYRLDLIGGDLTRGPLSITIQVHGFVPVGKAIYRHGAQTGDLVYVSGTLGDAGLALSLLADQALLTTKYHEYLLQRLNRPTPRIGLGLALRDIASSAIDISDGLLADLGHILTASHRGAIVKTNQLPLSDALQEINNKNLLDIILTSGDDYELCFTVPSERNSKIDKLFAGEFRLRCIGHVTDTPGIQWIQADGKPYTPAGSAYAHF